MNCIIPFTKDIKFTTNISEILSISLEHEYTANEGELLGNFIITGDYKTHEVSVNREHFEHVLPFSVTMTNRIDADSLDFAIEDFTYEIVDNNTLRVNIEYSVNATELPKEQEEIFEKVDEEPLEDLIIDRVAKDELDEEPEIVKETSFEEENAKKEQIENNEDRFEVPEELNEAIPIEIKNGTINIDEQEKIIDIDKQEEKRDMSNEDQEVVLESVNNALETFVTYHIHIMRETDTIDAVCTKYNTTQSILGEYNDLSTLTTGDKIIIPDINE